MEKVAIFTYSEDYKKAISDALGDQVRLINEEELDELTKNTEEMIYIIGVADETHRLDDYLHRDTYQSYKCDKLVNIHHHAQDMIFREFIGEIKTYIERYDRMLRCMQDIQDGKLTVQYDTWFFSGGHGEDCHMYNILKDGELYARVSIGEGDDTIEMDAPDTDDMNFINYGMYVRKNRIIYEYVSKIVNEALMRDDKPYVEALKEAFPPGSKLSFPESLPMDYHDISREDVISGRWGQTCEEENFEIEKTTWEMMWRDHNGDPTPYAMESAWNAGNYAKMTSSELRKENLETVEWMLTEEYNGDIKSFYKDFQYLGDYLKALGKELPELELDLRGLNVEDLPF